MKVSIITVLDNTNFGTYLQAMATAIAIKSLGHEPEIVRYTRPIMTAKGYSKTLLRERGFFRWLKRRRSIPLMLKLRALDYAYIQRFVAVTKEYCSFEELKKNPPIADVYMTGSDQVWNSIYNRGIDRSFYLDFAPDGKKRSSYAASIGMECFSEQETPVVKELLSKYSSITVREAGAKETLSKIGIKSDVVLDPTLLLDNRRWSDIASKDEMVLCEPFLLLYTVETKAQGRLIEHYAKEVAAKYNLKIYQVSYSKSGKGFSCVDRLFAEATPDVFLNLMKKASYVIVSSFHGTAFAINFNKPFLTIAANRFNSRVKNLLNITNLQHRLVTDDSLAIDEFKDIDYSFVNERLAKERQTSLSKLKNMIEG